MKIILMLFVAYLCLSLLMIMFFYFKLIVKNPFYKEGDVNNGLLHELNFIEFYISLVYGIGKHNKKIYIYNLFRYAKPVFNIIRIFALAMDIITGKIK